MSDGPPPIVEEKKRRFRFPNPSNVPLDKVDLCVLIGLAFTYFGVREWSQPAALVSVGVIFLTFAIIGSRR